MRRFEVADHSMEPTLRPGDYLVAVGSPTFAEGDIVVFEHQPGFHLVKRVAATAGDTVEIADGHLLLPGRPPRPVPAQPPQRWRVGPGELFVLSDAAMATRADSRQFGPVPASACLRVVLRYWPAAGIRWFGRRDVSAGDAPRAGGR